MAKVYGDKARQRVTMITQLQWYIQLPEESVRAYANHLKANLRQAGWNLQKHEDVFYNIAWAGLRNSLKNTVGPLMPVSGRFDSFHEIFDKAAASEVTRVEHMQPQQQQQQQQQQPQRKLPMDSSSKGDKRGSQLSISKPADTTGGGKSGQSGTNRQSESGGTARSSGLAPAPWVSMEMFESRPSTGKCLQCGSPNHKGNLGPKYSWGGNQPQHDQTLTPVRDGGHEIKRQKSFDNQQQKDS